VVSTGLLETGLPVPIALPPVAEVNQFTTPDAQLADNIEFEPLQIVAMLTPNPVGGFGVNSDFGFAIT